MPMYMQIKYRSDLHGKLFPSLESMCASHITLSYSIFCNYFFGHYVTVTPHEL